MQRIDVSRDADELAVAGSFAAQMCSEGDKRAARDAYSHKLIALRTSANIDVQQDEDASAPKTYAEVRDRIEHAQLLEELDEAIGMAREVEPSDHRAELLDIANARRDGFTQ